jgi:hypothetical protein
MPNFFLSYKRAGVAGRIAAGPGGGDGRLVPDLRQMRRDPAQGPPDSAMKLLPGQKS